jgi:hypothetical protein
MTIKRSDHVVAGEQRSTWYNDKNNEYITHTPDLEIPKTAEGLYVLARIGQRFMCVDRRDYVHSFMGLLDGRGPTYMQKLAKRVRKDLGEDKCQP